MYRDYHLPIEGRFNTKQNGGHLHYKLRDDGRYTITRHGPDREIFVNVVDPAIIHRMLGAPQSASRGNRSFQVDFHFPTDLHHNNLSPREASYLLEAIGGAVMAASYGSEEARDSTHTQNATVYIEPLTHTVAESVPPRTDLTRYTAVYVNELGEAVSRILLGRDGNLFTQDL